MSYGKLYGVGVGPGASDLLTVRAVKVLQEAGVLAIPQPNPYTKSLAFRIAKPHLVERDDQERLFLTFPMSKDKEVLRPHWEKAVFEIASRLKAGKNVAFMTQGDPLVYSSFIYLMEAMRDVLPGLEIEVVPGVTSISAVPSATGVPLCDGKERVAVLPATYGVEDLRTVMRLFDAVVLMKVSSVMPKVIEALEAEGLLERAVYVERATTDQQRVVWDLASLKDDKCVYFSMVVINKKDRAGELVDTKKLAESMRGHAL